MSTLLETVERTNGSKPTHSVIWLHGLGADGHDFEPIVPELAHPDLPNIRFVFPHAPIRPVTVNQGMPMRAWYDIHGLSRGTREDINGIQETRHAITNLITREVERGIPHEHIVLAGFSQGCAMALHIGLRHEHRLAGLIGLSGYLPLHDTIATERHPSNAATPVFLAHGTQDMVVTQDFAEAGRDVLIGLGQPVQWHTYPVPHGLHPQEVADIRTFFLEVFSSEK